jgi:hypothetical protein
MANPRNFSFFIRFCRQARVSAFVIDPSSSQNPIPADVEVALIEISDPLCDHDKGAVYDHFTRFKTTMR